MAKPRDVYLSDFLQDTATPLQWLLAWEAVADRERLEQGRAARAAARAMPLHVPIGEILAARSSMVA